MSLDPRQPRVLASHLLRHLLLFILSDRGVTDCPCTLGCIVK